MEDFSKLIGYVVMFFVVILGVGLLGAYITLDIAKLYEVPYVSTLNFSQMYGLTIVVGLLKNRAITKDSEDDYTPAAKTAISVVAILAVWAISYMAHGLFF